MASNVAISEEAGLRSLTAGQLECLRLVNKLQSSKQIARILGISRHTVDQRIAFACRKLGVASRTEAALLLADFEASHGPVPRDLPPAPLADLPSSPPAMPQLATWNRGSGSGDGNEEPLRVETPHWANLEAAQRFGAPFPTEGKRKNDLTIAQRLGWILGISFLAATTFLMLLAGLAALAQLV